METISILLLTYGLLFPIAYLYENMKTKKEISKEIAIASTSRNVINLYEMQDKYNICDSKLKNNMNTYSFNYKVIQLTNKEKKVNYVFSLFFPFTYFIIVYFIIIDSF